MSTEYPVYEPSTTNVRPSTNVGRFSTRTRLQSRGRRLYRKQVNTKTLFGAFIGVFISYFVLTARGEDSPQNTQPESLYRYEAPDLPPEKTLENSDPARKGVVVTNEKIEATAEEADAMIKSLSRSRPGAHVSVPPAATKAAVKAEDAAGGVKSQKEESATAKKAKKGGIFSRIANKFRGKDKDDAAAEAAAKAAEAADETKEAAGDAKVAEAADEAKEAGDAKVSEAGDEAEEAAGAKAEAAQPVTRPAGQPWSPSFVSDDSAPAQPQVRPNDGLNQANTVTRRSLPSPQDKNCRTFTFDASGSKDADEDKLTYEWEFGDNSKKSDAVRVKHTFPQSGEYKVTLIVSDHTGGVCETDTKSQLLYVNSAPIAVGTFPVELNANENGLFDARLSEDVQNDRLSYKWEFGDGTTSEEPVTSHSYKQPGEYRVILTVKDDSGTQCDTNVVSSMVSVNKPLLRKPFMALAEPNPVRPIQEVPEAPIVPADDGEKEQDGLLVQIRDHEGPEEEEEEVVVDTPKPEEEVREEKLRQPGLQFASIPVPEFIEERPEEQLADPRYLPQTHKYILAWAGGYMVDGPPIDCCDENKISFKKRTATHIERLLKTVDSGRTRLNLLEVSDQEKAKILAERTQDIAALDVKIDTVRTETRKESANAVVKLKKDFNELRENQENDTQKVFSILARNADAIRDTASEAAEHQKDNNRHKAGASRKSPGETPQTVNPDNYGGLSIPSEGQ
ncbi:MAG: PKD domain-containing protein [Planctomycetota bacterium]|jgi:PKD repeat protein|nr:PKD domain-containing protein [Planctomycetota bacterium]